jgi:BMFP domain-containing protein YqiC
MPEPTPKPQFFRISGRTKDAIIAAFATVLAAVILAAGGIIANARHEEKSVRGELAAVQNQLDLKTREAQAQAAALLSLRGEVERLRRAISVRDSRSETSKLTAEPILGQPHGSGEQQGFTVTLQRCTRAGQTVTCDMTVTNNEAERHFMIHASRGYNQFSRAIDNEGQERPVNEAEIGGQSGTGPITLMPSRVNIRAALRFRDVSPAVTQFNILQVVFSIGGATSFKIEFREIPIAA